MDWVSRFLTVLESKLMHAGSPVTGLTHRIGLQNENKAKT
jgi:hypothetical protein